MYEAPELYYLVWYSKGEEWLYFNGHFTEFGTFSKTKFWRQTLQSLTPDPTSLWSGFLIVMIFCLATHALQPDDTLLHS